MVTSNWRNILCDSIRSCTGKLNYCLNFYWLFIYSDIDFDDKTKLALICIELTNDWSLDAWIFRIVFFYIYSTWEGLSIPCLKCFDQSWQILSCCKGSVPGLAPGGVAVGVAADRAPALCSRSAPPPQAQGRPRGTCLSQRISGDWVRAGGRWWSAYHQPPS